MTSAHIESHGKGKGLWDKPETPPLRREGVGASSLSGEARFRSIPEMKASGWPI